MKSKLAGAGLLGPRRLSSTIGASGRAGRPSGNLRRALEELGPVFAAFGCYLSSRMDLLAVDDCWELGRIADQSEPLTPVQVSERIAEEAGGPAGDFFAEFDETPIATRLFLQEHSARLAGGDEVVVRIVRPGLTPVVERDLPLLAELAAILDCQRSALLDVIADFRSALRKQLDLTRHAEDLDSARRNAIDSDLVVVPTVHRRLTTSKLLVIERIAGTSLNRLASEQPPWPGRTDTLPNKLTLMWLEQALVSRTFPVEAEVLETVDGRLAIMNGTFSRLPTASQAGLWQYLRSIAAHRPELACELLLRELGPDVSRAVQLELERRIRELVPFRDGGWSEQGDSVAEHALLHWRAVVACGLDPPPYLQDFYRGVAWVTWLGYRLDPRKDALSRAMEDLQWRAGVKQLRQFADPSRLGDSLVSNLSGLLELPQKLDRLLDLATTDDGGLRVRISTASGSPRQRNKRAAVAAFCLALVGLIALSTRLPDFGVSTQAAQAVGALLFLVLGAVLLRTITKKP